MARRLVHLLALAAFPCVFGCRCGGGNSEGASGAGAQTSPTHDGATGDGANSGSSTNEGDVEVELHLLHGALIGFGNTTPLPVSAEFSEEVPEARPPLERAAKLRAGKPVRIRIERDVPFGQVTRLMQAAIAYRVGVWEVWSRGAAGALQSIEVKTPGPLPRGNCFATAWVGSDDKVQVGLDRAMTMASSDGGAAEMVGTIVWPVAGHVGVSNIVKVVHRLDARCSEGPFRVLASPTGSWGPPFDVARGMADANPKPHVSTLQLAVPSLGAMDSPVEVLKE